MTTLRGVVTFRVGTEWGAERSVGVVKRKKGLERTGLGFGGAGRTQGQNRREILHCSATPELKPAEGSLRCVAARPEERDPEKGTAATPVGMTLCCLWRWYLEAQDCVPYLEG